MEVVHELIYLLDRYSVRHIDVITNPRTAPDKKESRYHDYYIGMRENRWADEAAAAEAFGMEPDSKNWQRFKNEVKKRIANSLLFIEGDEQSISEYGKALITATQNWAVAKVCQARGAKKSFIEFANKTLDIAIKYELIDLVFEVTRTLKGGYYTNPSLRKEFGKMTTLSKIYTEAYMHELSIKDAFQEFLAPLADKKGTRLNAAEDAERIVNSFKELSINNKYLGFNYHFRMLHVYSKILRNKWAEALPIIKDATNLLKSKPFLQHSYYCAFLQQEVICFIMLKEPLIAQNSINEILVLHVEGTFGWFKTLELQTINSLYSQNYREAWDTYKLVTKHKLYNINVTPLDKETWRLFHAYLILLIRTNKLDVSPREKGDADKFRINSWLNDVGTLSLDKQGSNIPVLIFHTVFLLVEDRYDEYLNRMEALRKYKQRNLDPENEHYRTDCFIRLLDLFGENHSPKDLLQHASPLLKGLTSVSTDLLDSSFELEVMPYEHQWEWLLEVYTSRNKG